MEYRVEMTARASGDLHYLYNRIDAAELQSAAGWFNGLEIAIDSLIHLPQRCPVAPEGKQMRKPLRHLLYGRKPHIYRVIYRVDERRKIVEVLTIRHGAMDEARPDQLL